MQITSNKWSRDVECKVCGAKLHITAYDLNKLQYRDPMSGLRFVSEIFFTCPIDTCKAKVPLCIGEEKNIIPTKVMENIKIKDSV